MGTTIMHGAEKTSWLTLLTHPLAGATQFELSSSPIGWQIGDKLVIAGTDPITNTSISSAEEFEKDEVVNITSISEYSVIYSIFN